MIATILPGSSNFHAVGYNEHKVSKGQARLIEVKNFGSVGLFGSPTTEEKIEYLQQYSSRNERIRKAQFHVAISCKGKEMSDEELLDFAHRYLDEMGYAQPGQPLLVYSHHDTDNNHIHIITSRVAPDGTKIDHNHERIRSQQIIDKLLKNDRSKTTQDDLESAMGYRFNSFAQFKAIMTTMGYETFEKENKVYIKKGGMIQTSFPMGEMNDRYTYGKSDKRRGRQIRQLLLKYRDVCADKEELKKDMKKKFGIDLVFFGSKDKPFGYMAVDHSTKSVFHGARILKIDDVLDFSTQEERFSQIDNYINQLIQTNPTITRKGLSDKLHKYKAYIKDGVIHFNGQVTNLSQDIIKKLDDNRRIEWVNRFSPCSEEERALLCWIAKLEDPSIIPLSDYQNNDKKYKLAAYKLLCEEEGGTSLRERLKIDGFIIRSDGQNRFAIDFHRHIILNLSAVDIDLRKRITHATEPKEVHKQNKKTGTPFRSPHDARGGSRSDNREWEVGVRGNYDDVDDNRSLKI